MTPRKKLLEEVEKIEAMGQDSDKKAAGEVIKEYNRREKEDEEDEAQKLEVLTKKRRGPRIFSYKEELAINLANFLKEESLPKGWWFEVNILDKGIGLRVGNYNTESQQTRKFKISGDPMYDLNACYLFAAWAGDLALKEAEKKTDSGIFLPN